MARCYWPFRAFSSLLRDDALFILNALFGRHRVMQSGPGTMHRDLQTRETSGSDGSASKPGVGEEIEPSC